MHTGVLLTLEIRHAQILEYTRKIPPANRLASYLPFVDVFMNHRMPYLNLLFEIARKHSLRGAFRAL